MSDLLLKSCPICLEAIPFERVLFLLCGHNVCDICISKCQAKCVVCRKPIPPDTPHRIYLNMDEIEDRRKSLVIDKINRLNAKSSTADIAKASSAMEKYVTTAETDLSSNAEDILKAIESMNERITPVFHQLETLLEENKSLRGELRKSNEKYQASKQKLLKESQRAEERIQEKRETLERFRVSYQKLTRELEESQNSVAEGKKKINALKTKMKGLLRQNRSTGKSDAADASLVVEEPLSNPKTTIPYKRVGTSSSASSRPDSHHHTKRKKDMH